MEKNRHFAHVLATAFALLVALVVCPTVARAEGGAQMYRLYNQWTGEHFYTSSVVERDSLAAKAWTYEGVGWVAPEKGDEVYRLYNGYVNGGDHHYTVSVTEYEKLAELGWTKEGRSWFSGGGVEVYRQYNPYAETGTHNYTTDKAENDALVARGWKGEGTAWYAVAKGWADTLPNQPQNPTPEPSQPQNPSPEPSNPQSGTVYWVPGGEVWHTTSDCPSLKRSHSSSIMSGSISDAMAAGKKRVCKNCS